MAAEVQEVRGNKFNRLLSRQSDWPGSSSNTKNDSEWMNEKILKHEYNM